MASYISSSTNRAPYPGWIFFTYPRTSVLPTEFANQLITLLQPLSYTVCQERHQDAGENPLHLHALVQVPNRKWTPTSIKNLCRNVYPDDWKRIHFGRIVRHSSPAKAYRYLLKDPVGDVLQYGDPPTESVHPLIKAYARSCGESSAVIIARARAFVAREAQYVLASAMDLHRFLLSRVLRELQHYILRRCDLI